MKKVVCIGGGTGQSALLRGLKQINDIQLSAVIAMSDDGGSTGVLRNELNLPAMGDVRNVMLTLAEKEDLMSDIMNYRFGKNDGGLSGHSLGNIIISALTNKNHDFLKTIDVLSDLLDCKGRVLPSTDQSICLSAHMADGSIIDGETEIRDSGKKVIDVFYKEHVHSYQEVVDSIIDADYVLIGIGSLYTSILPNLIIDDVKKALMDCKGKVIYYCNCMSEVGETDDYSLEDHVEAIEKHVGKKVIDAVVYANDVIPQECLSSYAKEGAKQVTIKNEDHDYQIIGCSLLRFDGNVIRHDPIKVQQSFEKVMEA